MTTLSHIDEHGSARMVDVTNKNTTVRQACAEAIIHMSEQAYRAAITGSGPKGDVLATARIAGIMAIKRTSDLIPLCHPLAVGNATLDFEPLPEENSLRILATVKTNGPTGVEMEALTGASIAALTVYDMIKAVDKSSEIGPIRLLTKSGGKSGNYSIPQTHTQRVSSGFRESPVQGLRKTSEQSHHPIVSAQAKLGTRRQALRTFMAMHHLRASQWAKDANVPAAHIYSFLTGKTHAIAPEVLSKLANVVGVHPKDLLGGEE
jgi:cyclic pyranopterin phosphate synthase